MPLRLGLAPLLVGLELLAGLLRCTQGQCTDVPQCALSSPFAPASVATTANSISINTTTCPPYDRAWTNKADACTDDVKLVLKKPTNQPSSPLSVGQDLSAFGGIRYLVDDETAVGGGLGMLVNGVQVFGRFSPCGFGSKCKTQDACPAEARNCQVDSSAPSNVVDAVDAESQTNDNCGGHASPQGGYHVHVEPGSGGQRSACQLPNDVAGQHSPLLGYAYDGVPLYGSLSDGGIAPSDLDSCNGHTHAIDGVGEPFYHYHFTDRPPWSIGCHAYCPQLGSKNMMERAAAAGCPDPSVATPPNVPASPAPATADKPSVLILLLDDVGFDWLKMSNSDARATQAKTPHMDSLAERGVIFEHAYANPLCAPSRSAMLTGRRPHVTGLTAVVTQQIVLDYGAFKTVAERAHTADPGIRTGLFGKWGVGHFDANMPNLAGFSRYAGSLRPAITDYYNFEKTVDGTTSTQTTYATTDIVDDTVAFIKEEPGKRFLAFVTPNAAHSPVHKPPPTLLSAKTKAALNSYDTEPTKFGDEGAVDFFSAMIEAIDHELGRLLQDVDLETTMVVVMGDNGTPTKVNQKPNMAGRGKGSLWQGGIRVPLLFAGAGIGGTLPRRVDASAPAAIYDLFATVLEVMGESPAAAAKDVSARSLMPYLRSDMPSPPQSDTRIVVLELANHDNGNNGVAAVGANHKLVEFTDTQETHMYSLDDPEETTNLIAGGLASLSDSQRAAYDLLLPALSTSWMPPEVPEDPESEDPEPEDPEEPSDGSDTGDDNDGSAEDGGDTSDTDDTSPTANAAAAGCPSGLLAASLASSGLALQGTSFSGHFG